MQCAQGTGGADTEHVVAAQPSRTKHRSSVLRPRVHTRVCILLIRGVEKIPYKLGPTAIVLVTFTTDSVYSGSAGGRIVVNDSVLYCNPACIANFERFQFACRRSVVPTSCAPHPSLSNWDANNDILGNLTGSASIGACGFSDFNDDMLSLLDAPMPLVQASSAPSAVPGSLGVSFSDALINPGCVIPSDMYSGKHPDISWLPSVLPGDLLNNLFTPLAYSTPPR